jgi:hypothetical protein
MYRFRKIYKQYYFDIIILRNFGGHCCCNDIKIDKEMMITNKIILNIFLLSFFLILSLNVISIPTSAYTFQIPLCNSTVNTSCINLNTITPVTNAPINGIMYWRDGNLYLTNDTVINYTIINNITNITYQNNITNITYQTTNVTTYVYNISNGSSLIVYQNITANDSIIRDWINSKLNSSFSNTSLLNFYNKTDAEITFALKTELIELRSNLVNYATKADVDKYGRLLVIDTSGLNETLNLQELVDNNGLSMTWMIIIIVNCVLVVVLMIAVVKLMMNG